MAKVNHRDTLDSQLRELQRRLRLLEARHTTTTASAHFVPARSTDWWQLSDAPEWTDLASATVPAKPTSLRLHADGDGDVRVQVDGQPDAQYPAGEHVVALPAATAGSTVRIQARGTINVFATLV